MGNKHCTHNTVQTNEPINQLADIFARIHCYLSSLTHLITLLGKPLIFILLLKIIAHICGNDVYPFFQKYILLLGYSLYQIVLNTPKTLFKLISNLKLNSGYLTLKIWRYKCQLVTKSYVVVIQARTFKVVTFFRVV